VTRILPDTNLVIDVLQKRMPYFNESLMLWALIEEKKAVGYLAAHAVTTVHCFLRKQDGGHQATQSVSELLRLFRIATVNESVIREAVLAGSSDFEDAVTAAAAQAAGCGLIATRDPKGFRNSPVPAVFPKEALRAISGRAT
jgi:predicted nucleic acid-binding protein